MAGEVLEALAQKTVGPLSVHHPRRPIEEAADGRALAVGLILDHLDARAEAAQRTARRELLEGGRLEADGLVDLPFGENPSGELGAEFILDRPGQRGGREAFGEQLRAARRV